MHLSDNKKENIAILRRILSSCDTNLDSLQRNIRDNEFCLMEAQQRRLDTQNEIIKLQRNEGA